MFFYKRNTKRRFIKPSNTNDLQKRILELENSLRTFTTKHLSQEELLALKSAGDKYEKKVGEYFEHKGYDVIYHGLEHGVKDEGIDLIAKKSKEILLIQCKYWKKSESISASMIKEFYGNCNFYIDKHNLDKEITSPIYVICEKSSLSYGAKKIFSDYQNSVQVLVLK